MPASSAMFALGRRLADLAGDGASAPHELEQGAGQGHRIGHRFGELDPLGVLSVVIADEQIDAVAIEAADHGASRRRAVGEDPGDEHQRVLEVVVEPLEQLAAVGRDEGRDRIVLGGAHDLAGPNRMVGEPNRACLVYR